MNYEVWWLSSSRMTVTVYTTDGRISRTAPIVRKFVGQPLTNLVRWMQAQGGFRMERIDQ